MIIIVFELMKWMMRMIIRIMKWRMKMIEFDMIEYEIEMNEIKNIKRNKDIIEKKLMNENEKERDIERKRKWGKRCYDEINEINEKK
jgi:hypothetical protein